MSKNKQLRLAQDLSFSTDIITEVIDLIAKRGSGKTYTATKLAEEMLLVGAQVVIVDPVGNWYGLRLGADGKASGGLDIKILGGRHGDIPLEHTAGALVAQTIVDTGMSVILDVSMLSKPKQRRFITDFSISLLEARKRYPSAMHIFWEEAYRFMPQKMAKGSKNEMLEATEELVTMGRNFGIGGTIICQRSAQISKTVLTQASILLAMNTTGLADRKVIEAWVDYHDIEAQKLDLSKLAKGEAYVWWPEEFGIRRITVTRKNTYDASATPKFGEKSQKRKLKVIDLDALEVSMSETIKKVQDEDPRHLKRRIAALEKSLADAESRPVGTKHVPAVSNEVLVRLETAVSSLRDATDQVATAIATVQGSPPILPEMRSAAARVKHLAPARPVAARSKPIRSLEVTIQAGALRMLKSLAAVSPGGLTKKQVATAARMKSSSGTFGTYWSKLSVAGFIGGYGDGKYSITSLGMSYLGDDIPTQPDSPEERVDFWCERLSGKAKELLRYLFDHEAERFTKAELGEAVGLVHTSGTFGTYLSSLTSNNLAVRDGSEYHISPDLFA